MRRLVPLILMTMLVFSKEDTKSVELRKVEINTNLLNIEIDDEYRNYIIDTREEILPLPEKLEPLQKLALNDAECEEVYSFLEKMYQDLEEGCYAYYGNGSLSEANAEEDEEIIYLGVTTIKSKATSEMMDVTLYSNFKVIQTEHGCVLLKEIEDRENDIEEEEWYHIGQDDFDYIVQEKWTRYPSEVILIEPLEYSDSYNEYRTVEIMYRNKKTGKKRPIIIKLHYDDYGKELVDYLTEM